MPVWSGRFFNRGRVYCSYVEAVQGWDPPWTDWLPWKIAVLPQLPHPTRKSSICVWSREQRDGTGV